MTTSPRGDPVNEATARQHALRTASTPLGLELHQPGQDLWAAILPNPSNPAVPYKVQYFAAFGLAGHQVHPTPEAALAAALAEGFTEPDPGALKRLSRTPAWTTRYDTSPVVPAPATALSRVLRALARLEQQGATVDAITFRRGRVPPLIVVSGAVPTLSWRCYVWGCDRRGRYRRLAASLEGCQVVREVRDGPPRPHSRR